MGHTPFELAPPLARLIREGALEDSAEEQEPSCAVVQLLIAHVMSFQDIVYDLHAVGTR